MAVHYPLFWAPPMTVHHSRRCVLGAIGQIELLIDTPVSQPTAIALIAHPHPLLGGTAEHKVPSILARTLRDRGWLTVRPNFRGTGQSEGIHDGGVGEADDLVVISGWVREEFPGLPLVLIGFSFGAYVQTRVARQLEVSGAPQARLVLIGPGIGQVEGGRRYDAGDVPHGTLVIHGEADERVPLSNVLRWADPQMLPVVVVPGADHFFNRRLPALAGFVRQWLADIGNPKNSQVV